MRLWPRSLQGQLLLAIALALLAGQAISGLLLFAAAEQRREQAAVSALALRLVAAQDRETRETRGPRWGGGRGFFGRGPRFRVERGASSPLRSFDRAEPELTAELGEVLAAQGFGGARPTVVSRPPLRDPRVLQRIAARRWQPREALTEARLLLAITREADGTWLTARVLLPPRDPSAVRGLLLQTVLLFVLLLGLVALVLRRITRPLAALTGRMERFAGTRDGAPPLEPQGPDDVRRLIAAHNALEARIAALLDEKDVMLGAIGHDLKTPLAALRVRIESVEDEAERAKMAATIEDIARSLDDILSLARVGRPSDPLEPTELGALAASVVEEYEDRGEPVTLADAPRIALPLRATWLRRAMRNLIDNALRYGGEARVSLAREGPNAVIHIDDDGPGIPEGDIARMLEPFTRLEASRNTATGGAGLGLTLARAIAEQHGGELTLANRLEGGLRASISLPLE